MLWLIILVVTVSFCIGVYVSELPSRSSVFLDVWSFLYFIIIYGSFVGLFVGAGVVGALLGMLARKRIGGRH
jgi:hypothetical protein